ncbi:hypothetical protein ACFLZ8_03620, partial [Planctomycetota bacterium]
MRATSKTIRIELKPKSSLESISIVDSAITRSGDGFEQDDKYYLSVRVPQKKEINVLLAEEKEDEMFLIETAIRTLSFRSVEKLISIRSISFDELDSAVLDWADILVCSGITSQLGRMIPVISGFVKTGGRIVFFLTGTLDAEAAGQLWKSGVLPALPRQIVRQVTYPQTNPCDNEFYDIDTNAAKALMNYRIDKIPVYSYWDMESVSADNDVTAGYNDNSKCFWRYMNGAEFISYRQAGNGAGILINTSSDGSTGAITKSGASVALCQYMLSENTRIRDYTFVCGDHIVLPVTGLNLEPGENEQFWIRGVDGLKKAAVLSESYISVSESGGPGWLQTLSEPAIYAGVNLPEDEVIISKPTAEEVDDAVNRVFSTREKNNLATMDALSQKEQQPVWKILLWVIILLLLVETALANRLRR